MNIEDLRIGQIVKVLNYDQYNTTVRFNPDMIAKVVGVRLWHELVDVEIEDVDGNTHELELYLPQIATIDQQNMPGLGGKQFNITIKKEWVPHESYGNMYQILLPEPVTVGNNTIRTLGALIDIANHYYEKSLNEDDSTVLKSIIAFLNIEKILEKRNKYLNG